MRLAAVVGAATALAAGSVQAATVSLQHMSNGNGRVVRATVNSASMNVFAGRLNNTAHWSSGATTSIVTFSTDLFQSCPNAMSPYTTSSISQLSGNAGATNLGMGKMQAVYDIFGAAAGREYTLGHDYACAFQIALWEIVYDFNPSAPNQGMSVTSGAFKATQTDGTALSQSIRDKVNFLLNSVVLSNYNGSGVSGYRSGGYMDQVAQILPLPNGAWMAAGGLGLAVAVRRRLKRG